MLSKTQNSDEDEAEEMEGFEEAHGPGGPTVEARQARQGRGTTYTDDAATSEEDANHRAGGVGEKERSTVAGPTFIHESHAESQGHGTGHAFATGMRAHPGLGKFLKCCFLATCTVAWFCSHAHPGRHWPTCFDQTCG